MDNQQRQQPNNTTQPSSQSSTQNRLRMARNQSTRERERERLAAGDPEMRRVFSDRILRRRFAARTLRANVNTLRSRRERNEHLDEEELAVLAQDDRKRQRRAEYDRMRYARHRLERNPPEQDNDDTSTPRGDSQPAIEDASLPNNQVLPASETIHNGNQDEEIVVMDNEHNEVIQRADQASVENIVEAPSQESENNNVEFAPEEQDIPIQNQDEEVGGNSQANIAPVVPQDNIVPVPNVVEQANAVAALQQLHNQSNNNPEVEVIPDPDARFLYYHRNQVRNHQARVQSNRRGRSRNQIHRQEMDSVLSLLTDRVSIRDSDRIPTRSPWAEFENCPICRDTRDELIQGNLELVKLPCRHILCRKCLVGHINANGTRDAFYCPICRHEYTFRSAN